MTTNENIIIRPEKAADIEAIFRITADAFKDHPYSQQTEPFIVNALRADGALVISLVAELYGQVVGHVAFSPMTLSDGGEDWYGLGPVSVAPTFQNRGIGSAVIQKGLASLKEMGARGCILVGDPAFYTRFGFKSYAEMTMEGVPGENLLALAFYQEIPKGEVTHHPGFFATC